MSSDIFSEVALRRDLSLEAKSLGIPAGSADIFIDKTIAAVKKKIGSRKILTQLDLTRMVVSELKKYNSDFAYVYQNHDKII